MKLQIIYTLEQGQEIANFDFKPQIIATKKSFIAYCLNALKTRLAFADSVESWRQNPKEKEVPKVVKLSGCVFMDGKKFVEPRWWKKANGKVYFDN